MDNSSKRPFQVNHLLVVFVGIQLVFLVVGVFAIVSQMNADDKVDMNDPSTQPHISIEGFAEKVNNFPVDKLDLVQNSLLDIVLANVPDINLGETKAVVRDDGVYERYFGLINVGYSSAIIDIPELEQSYQVFLQHSNDAHNKYLDPNGSIVFLCVTDSAKIIYTNFSCTDMVSQKTRNALVGNYVKFFEFDGFRARTGDYENIVIVPDDFNAVDEENYINQVRLAIESMGVSPDLFKYEIMQASDYDYQVNGN